MTGIPVIAIAANINHDAEKHAATITASTIGINITITAYDPGSVIIQGTPICRQSSIR